MRCQSKIIEECLSILIKNTHHSANLKTAIPIGKCDTIISFAHVGEIIEYLPVYPMSILIEIFFKIQRILV